MSEQTLALGDGWAKRSKPLHLLCNVGLRPSAESGETATQNYCCKRYLYKVLPCAVRMILFSTV